MTVRVRLLLCLVGVGVAVVVALGGGLTGYGVRLAAAQAPVGPSVMLVGDSLTYEASGAIPWTAPVGGTTWVHSDGGTAPCDWTGRFARLFLTDVDRAGHTPRAVVLAFTGNDSSPCMAGAATGRNVTAEYLRRYQYGITAMATYAQQHGARVYLTESPAMLSPVKPNGNPQLRSLLVQLAAGSGGAWVMDDDADQMVSPGHVFRWYLPCLPGEQPCARSGVLVRASDHLHLTANGAFRYAFGLTQRPWADQAATVPALPQVAARARTLTVPPPAVAEHSGTGR